MAAKKLSTQTENLPCSTVACGIILLGFVLRLWYLPERTEFLGDQGSAMATVYEAWQAKQLLLTGPQMSTGYFPGPAFYYLVAPAIIASGFHLLSGPFAFIILGTITSIYLYLGVRALASERAGLIAATLYSVTPFFVTWDQRMWNPTAIAFFVSLLLYCAVTSRFHPLRKFFVIGSASGILFQLHPTTLIVSLPVVTYALLRKSVKEGILVVLGAGIVLVPLLWYELQHDFANFQVLVHSFFQPKSPFVVHYFIGMVILGVVGVSVGIAKFLARVTPKVFILSLAVFCVVMSAYGVTAPVYHDIPRLKEVVVYLKTMVQNKPFSFTVYGSRSFSDYHYRWLFSKESLSVVSVREGKSKDLYVVCENRDCPTFDELREVASFTSMCDEKFCIGPYPEIRATEYELKESKKLMFSTVYYYTKK